MAKKNAAPAAAETPAAAPASETAAVEQVAAAEVAEASIYDMLMTSCRAVDPNFAAPHAKEDDQTFFKRIVRILAEAPDEVWSALPLPGQTWYNEAADAVTAQKAVGAPAGFADRKAETPAEGAATAGDAKAEKLSPSERMKKINAEKKAAKEAAIARGEAPPAKAPAKEKPAKPAAEPKGPGIVSTMRRAYIKDQSLGAQALLDLAMAALPGKTSSIGTAAAVITDTKATIDILRDLGMLKG